MRRLILVAGFLLASPLVLRAGSEICTNLDFEIAARQASITEIQMDASLTDSQKMAAITMYQNQITTLQAEKVSMGCTAGTSGGNPTCADLGMIGTYPNCMTPSPTPQPTPIATPTPIVIPTPTPVIPEPTPIPPVPTPTPVTNPTPTPVPPVVPTPTPVVHPTPVPPTTCPDGQVGTPPNCRTVGGNGGGDGDKVTICHKDGFRHHTITVDQNALPAHLSHGDTIGECREGTDRDDDDDVRRECDRMKQRGCSSKQILDYYRAHCHRH